MSMTPLPALNHRIDHWATTDKLSWHDETLDDSPSVPCDITTMDQCYSETFPGKDYLVATTDALYMLDGSNNTMWMKFSKNASGYALGTVTNNTISSVTATNGVIYVGTNGTSAGGLSQSTLPKTECGITAQPTARAQTKALAIVIQP